MLSRSRRLNLVAGLSLTAATVHLLAMSEHLHVWWGYAAFFMVAAILQAAFAVLLPDAPGRLLLALGLAGNLAVVLLYATTRTVGVPLLGPEAGEVEPIQALDVVATLAEVAVVLLLAPAVARPDPAPSHRSGLLERAAGTPLLLRLGFVVLAAGGALDVVEHTLATTTAGGLAAGGTGATVGHLVSFAGMLLSLAGVLVSASRRAPGSGCG